MTMTPDQKRKWWKDHVVVAGADKIYGPGADEQLNKMLEDSYVKAGPDPGDPDRMVRIDAVKEYKKLQRKMAKQAR